MDKNLPFCVMLKEAQERGTPFYFGKGNETCVGSKVLGMVDMLPFVEGGQVGPKLDVYDEPRANNKIYQFAPEFSKGTANFVAFSPIDQLTFDPDVLIIYATVNQAEIVLRAAAYSIGELWEIKGTPVLGCAWIYIYPYQSGKLNYSVTGLTFGVRARQVFPAGNFLISIPYNLIPTITQNLKDMPWVPGSYTDTIDEFEQRDA